MIDIKKLLKNEKLTVTYEDTEGCYEFKLKNDNSVNPIVAVIFENGLVKYFVSGVYNNDFDYAEIDIEELRELREIIEEE